MQFACDSLVMFKILFKLANMFQKNLLFICSSTYFVKLVFMMKNVFLHACFLVLKKSEEYFVSLVLIMPPKEVCYEKL
jgi:hypothetical protein